MFFPIEVDAQVFFLAEEITCHLLKLILEAKHGLFPLESFFFQLPLLYFKLP